MLCLKKNFFQKLAKNRRFFAQATASVCKHLIAALVFWGKTAIASPKIGKKSQKIVIIISTPVANPTTFEFTATTPAL
jgi:hypothetical protein